MLARLAIGTGIAGARVADETDQAPEIDTPEKLQAWLQDKPVEWAKVIAVRAALRVFPLVFDIHAFSDKRLETGRKQELILLVFRANFISRLAPKYPSREMAAAAAAAADAADAAAAADDANAYAAAYAAARAATAAAAYAADAAADAAARAAIRAATWEAVSRDCRWLLQLGERNDLIDQQLWPLDVRGKASYRANFPPWVREPFDRFVARDEVNNGPWHLIVDWYRALLPDSDDATPRSLFGKEADIAIATKPRRFWTITEERSAEDVLRDIAEIAGYPLPGSPAPDWHFCLSYTEKDLAVARRISDALENEGYSVFSQFNDMTAGKSFVGEMNRGLAGMGRMIAVYSPDYFTSGPCNSEWEAAYTADPSGKSGKVVPFLARPCEVPPLARRLVWTSLLGLSPADERAAVLKAVRGALAPRERAAQRAALKAAVSPDVGLDPGGRRLDAMPNAAFDEPFVDEDLFDLPERLRRLVETIVADLEGRNSPRGLTTALRAYAGELEARGANCSLGVLRDQMAYVEAEVDDPDAENWCYGAGLKASIGTLRRLHALLLAHYPLDQERERLLRAIEVDDDMLDPQRSARLRQAIRDAVREAFEVGRVTESYRAAVENRDRVARDILDLRDPDVPTEGDPDHIRREQDRSNRVRDAKKRTLAQTAGFADKSLDMIGKLAKLADSASLQRVARALREYADWFWGP